MQVCAVLTQFYALYCNRPVNRHGYYNFQKENHVVTICRGRYYPRADTYVPGYSIYAGLLTHLVIVAALILVKLLTFVPI